MRHREISVYTRHNFFPFLSLSLFPLYFFFFPKHMAHGRRGEQRMIPVYPGEIWGGEEGDKKMSRSCNKNDGFQGNSRTLRESSPSSPLAKISGGCCQEYFVAEETSPLRASLREDRDTLSGFNGQCPLRRKFRGTLVPKFAGSQGARHRGLVPPGYRPECQVSPRTRE